MMKRSGLLSVLQLSTLGLAQGVAAASLAPGHESCSGKMSDDHAQRVIAAHVRLLESTDHLLEGTGTWAKVENRGQQLPRLIRDTKAMRRHYQQSHHRDVPILSRVKQYRLWRKVKRMTRKGRVPGIDVTIDPFRS
jgi:hypothetical protein